MKMSSSSSKMRKITGQNLKKFLETSGLIKIRVKKDSHDLSSRCMQDAGLNYQFFVLEIYEKFIQARQPIEESQTMIPPRSRQRGPASSAYLGEREITIGPSRKGHLSLSARLSCLSRYQE